jgi:hypothetical protein
MLNGEKCDQNKQFQFAVRRRREERERSARHGFNWCCHWESGTAISTATLIGNLRPGGEAIDLVLLQEIQHITHECESSLFGVF